MVWGFFMLSCCICLLFVLSTFCVQLEFDMFVKLCAQIWNIGHYFWGLCSAFYNHFGHVGVRWQITNPSTFTYAWADLLELQHASQKIPVLPLLDLSPERLLRKRIWRKRGSKGGIRNRLRRRGSKLPLPAFPLSNVRSLWNKMDELKCHCLRTL